jgi:uncharacterized protein involved in outer membrane biogenesis
MQLRSVVGWIALAIVAILVVAYTALHFQNYDRIKGMIEQAVGDATGRQLSIQGPLRLAILPAPTLVVKQATLANADWSSEPDMVSIGVLKLRLSFLPLLRGNVAFKNVQLQDTRVLLETDATGDANWRFSPADAGRADVGMKSLSIRRLSIEDLTVSLRRPGSAPDDYQLDHLELSRTPDRKSLAVALHGKLNDQPVALSGTTGRLSELFSGARFPLDLSGRLANTRVSLEGSIGDVLKLAGIDLELDAAGSDLADIGTAVGAPLPETESFQVNAHLGGEQGEVAIQKLHAAVEAIGGRVDATGSVGDLANLSGIRLELNGSGTDIAKLGPTLGMTLPSSGPFQVSGTITGSASDLALGDARGTISAHGMKLSVTGSVGDLLNRQDIDLALDASGSDLAPIGRIIDQPLPHTDHFSATGTVTGSATALALGNAQASVSARGAKLSITGSIGDLLERDGIDLVLDASGGDLAPIGEIIGQPLPKTDRFAASGKVTGSAAAPTLSDAKGTVSSGSLKLSVKGAIGDLLGLEKIDLRFDGSGDDLAQLGPLVGQSLPATAPFSASGRLTGSASALTLRDARARTSHNGVEAALGGGVRNVQAVEGIDVNWQVSGGSLADVADLLETPLPSTGPFTASGRVTGSPAKLQLDVLSGRVRHAQAELHVNGQIDDVTNMQGIALDFHGSGEDLAELGSLFHAEWPSLGAFEARGNIAGSRDLLDVKRFSATIENSDFAGWSRIELGDKPKVSVKLESGLIDFTRIMDQLQEDRDTAAGSEAGADGKSPLSQDPLPFELLSAVDADISLTARNLKARQAALEFGKLALRVDAGQLHLDTLEAVYKASRLSANLSTRAGPPPHVSARFLVQDFKLGAFLTETGITDEVEASADIAADLRSLGQSPYDLVSNLDGVFALVLGSGKMPRFLDLLAEDLSRRVIPIWGQHKEAGNLKCAVVQFGIQQGLASSDAFLFDTQIGLLKGDGTIELPTEQIDFLLSPHPKKMSLFSLKTKIRVTGSLSDPKVRPDTKSLLKKGSKALSALLVGPAGLLAPFVTQGARHKHPCDMQALRGRLDEVYR